MVGPGCHSSAVTSTGPTGVRVLEGLALQPLPGAELVVPHADVVHDGVAGDRGAASSRSAPRTAVPTTTTSSHSQSTASAAGRERDVVAARPMSALRELREEGRVLGKVPAHLQDVRAVVEPDAHDLGRARNQRRPGGFRPAVCCGPAAGGSLAPSRAWPAARRRRRHRGSAWPPATDRRPSTRTATVPSDVRRVATFTSAFVVRRHRVPDRSSDPVEGAAARRSGRRRIGTGRTRRLGLTGTRAPRTARRRGRPCRARGAPVAEDDGSGAVEHLPDRGPDLPPGRRGRRPRAAGGTRRGWSAGRRRRWSG